MRAKKSLGQHFLTSRSALRAIVDAAHLLPDDLVLEIGPGRGVLTAELLKVARRVVAVEKDETLAEFLRQKFAPELSSGKIEIVVGDILNFDPTYFILNASCFKLVSNIPYNITGAILEKFLGGPIQPSSMTLLVQKEVAERILARNGKESILSISVKAYSVPKYIRTVPTGAFNPPPKVDSAILNMENIGKKFFLEISEEKFFAVVRAGFAHKRKLLLGNLSKFANKEKLLAIFRATGISEKSRAESLTPNQWERITRSLRDSQLVV